jgi:hypothetical protein
MLYLNGINQKAQDDDRDHRHEWKGSASPDLRLRSLYRAKNAFTSRMKPVTPAEIRGLSRDLISVFRGPIPFPAA